MARPSSYSPERANAICERLADGESLRQICETKGFPDKETVRRWLREHEEFRAQYTRAREEQADHYADEILKEAFSATDASLGRLRMDALKWTASKLAPKKYGDKVDANVKHEGSIGITVVVNKPA